MLHVTESKAKGLTISIEASSPTQKAILEAVLTSARCSYSSHQKAGDPYVHYTVDTKEAGKVKTLVQGWSQGLNDLQFAIDTRLRTA